MIYVNTRNLIGSLTGVQRYTLEIVDRLSDKLTGINNPQMPDGIKGHLWEQAILPFQLKDNLLWSPSNTGPLGYAKQVVTLHDVVPLDHPEWLNANFARWYQALTPQLVKRVRHVVTISEFSKNRIVELMNVPEDRITVVPNGVDPRFQPKSELEIAEALRALALPTSKYILSLGSLEPRKNLPRLLKAWELIQDQLPEDVWLVLAGGKGKAMVFKDHGIEQLPKRVHMTGHVLDAHLPALYSGAMAFAYMSVYEGFGLPPLEAMSAGTPTLTGNLTAIPEVVGDAGLMVDPYNVEAIAEGLLTLINNQELRQTLKTRGLLRAQDFSWDDTAKQTWEILNCYA